MLAGLGLALSCKCELHFSQEASVTVPHPLGVDPVIQGLGGSWVWKALGSGSVKVFVSRKACMQPAADVWMVCSMH